MCSGRKFCMILLLECDLQFPIGNLSLISNQIGKNGPLQFFYETPNLIFVGVGFEIKMKFPFAKSRPHSESNLTSKVSIYKCLNFISNLVSICRYLNEWFSNKVISKNNWLTRSEVKAVISIFNILVLKWFQTKLFINEVNKAWSKWDWSLIKLFCKFKLSVKIEANKAYSYL